MTPLSNTETKDLTLEQRDSLMHFMEREDVYQLWRSLGEPQTYFRFCYKLQDFINLTNTTEEEGK